MVSQRLSMSPLLFAIAATAFVTVAPFLRSASAFVPPGSFVARASPTPLPTSTRLRVVADDVDVMKAKDIREELESYGIPTKAFFEKREMADALKRARSKGRTPAEKTPSGGGGGSSSATSKTRDERIREEMTKIKPMKVGIMKKELEEMGVSTKSFFEKSEFVRALAEARVDGGVKENVGRGVRKEREPDYDSSYRDVIIEKIDPNNPDPRNHWHQSGSVIDVTIRQ